MRGLSRQCCGVRREALSMRRCERHSKKMAAAAIQFFPLGECAVRRRRRLFSGIAMLFPPWGGESSSVRSRGIGGWIAVFCHPFEKRTGIGRLIRASAFDHACLFSSVRKKEAACDASRFYSAWVGIAFCAFSCVGAVIRPCGFTMGLRVSCWRFRRSYGRGWLYEKERRLALAFLLI